jgi:hypothetical protein
MVRSPKQYTQNTDSEVTEFMSAFARYLVASGITTSRFTSIMRIAFYQAAALEARFSNKRLNRSGVAIMTGLTRAQVRELSKQEKLFPKAKNDRIENIVEGWATDPAFMTSGYLPKRLSFGRKNAAFNSLIRKYGGDVPPKSVLREMIRTRCVKVEGGYVSLTSNARKTIGQSRLQNLCQSLVKLLKDSERRRESLFPLRVLNGEVVYPATSAKGRILMQKRSGKSLRALMDELQAAGTAASIEAPPSPGQKGWVTRTRIVLISEELDDECAKAS